MISTFVGIIQNSRTPYNLANRAAAFLDFAGFVTMLVLGALALIAANGVQPQGLLLFGGGAFGLTILALKYVKAAPNPSVL